MTTSRGCSGHPTAENLRLLQQNRHLATAREVAIPVAIGVKPTLLCGIRNVANDHRRHSPLIRHRTRHVVELPRPAAGFSCKIARCLRHSLFKFQQRHFPVNKSPKSIHGPRPHFSYYRGNSLILAQHSNTWAAISARETPVLLGIFGGRLQHSMQPNASRLAKIKSACQCLNNPRLDHTS